VDVDALVPGIEVLESAGIVSFGKPVGDEESEIKVAVLKATVGDGGFVELVDADGDQLDLCSGMVGFKKAGFFGESVLEVRVVAKGDAQGAHAASSDVARGLEVFAREWAMTGFNIDVAAEEV